MSNLFELRRREINGEMHVVENVRNLSAHSYVVEIDKFTMSPSC